MKRRVGKIYRLKHPWCFFEVENFGESLRLVGGTYQQEMMHLAPGSEEIPRRHLLLYLGRKSYTLTGITDDHHDYFLYDGRIIVTVDWPTCIWDESDALTEAKP